MRLCHAPGISLWIGQVERSETGKSPSQELICDSEIPLHDALSHHDLKPPVCQVLTRALGKLMT